MTKHSAKEGPRSRSKASSTAFFFGLLVTIVLMGIGGFFYWRHVTPQLAIHQKESAPTSISPPSMAESTKQPAQSVTGYSLPSGENSFLQDAAPQEKNENLENSSETGTLSPETAEPQHLVNELNAFYTHLDQQSYMRDFGLKEPSKVHFSKLLQKLIDNPPVVIRETDDILTLLKNTAHFYRILDKDNITILKGILDRDRKSLEHILKTFYALTYHPDYLQKEYSLTFPLEALHDYAAFFLNTIGGKLYLFRRDSASRMTVSYYAIQVIDRANQEGSNPQGIDLRPAIDSLIEEIENTGKNLKYKNEYLDNLYDLKEKYN